MAQCKLFNLSLGETGELCGGTSFQDFFFSKQGFLVRSLAVPFAHPMLDAVLKSARKAMKARRALLSLPDETLAEIISYQDISLPDIVAFAITCKRLFAVLAPAIGVARLNCAARWAGGRIACVGERARYSKLPPTLLNHQEREVVESTFQYQQSHSVQWSFQNPAYKSVECGEVSIDNWPWGRLDHLCWGVSPVLWRGVNDYQRDDWYRSLEGRDLERFNLVLALMYPERRKDWLLLNLSKMEYVKASAMANLSGRPNDPQPFLPNCKADLGHALLVRICLATGDGTRSNKKPMWVERGPWAGDRFCITTMDRVAKQKGEQRRWKDVSTAVVWDVKKIFESVYGDKAFEVLRSPPPLGDAWFWFVSDGDGRAVPIGSAILNVYG